MYSRNEIGALILRVVLGIAFFVHGYVKFSGGIENQAAWFASIGLPGFFAYVVAIIELVGGFALIIGLGTRIVSLLLAIIMVGAIITVKLPLGFLGNGQMAGYELDVVLFAMAAYLAIAGNKMFSLDHILFGKNSKEA